METIFGCEWGSLSLDHIRAFLASADAEGLQWEAKGGRLDEHSIRKTVCAFANSHDGGYLILGADGDADGHFALGGLPFPDEPPLWISNVLRDGLRPYPRVDVHAFLVDESHHVAVVWTPPLADPPCICRGTVYERVPGASPVVKDPSRLAELYQRGDSAHASARVAAVDTNHGLLGSLIEWLESTLDGASFLGFSLTLAATGYAEGDVASRLFTETFETQACDALLALDSNEPPPIQAQIDHREWTQNSLTFRRVARYPFSPDWTLRATANGTVAIAWFERNQQTVVHQLVDGPLAAAWTAAAQMVDALGGRSALHIVIQLFGRQFVELDNIEFARHLEALPTVRRGPLPFEVDATQLSSVEREIRRSLGEPSYEP